MNKLEDLLSKTNSVVAHVSVVRSTKTYNQFAFLPGNRNGCDKDSEEAIGLNLNPNRDKEFKKRRRDWVQLFEKNNGMDEYNPIKVALVLFEDGTIKLTILDGQGRRAAIAKIAKDAGEKFQLYFEVVFPDKIFTLGEAQDYVISINSQSNEWHSANKREHYMISKSTSNKVRNEMNFITKISEYFGAQDTTVDNIWFGQGSTKKENYFPDKLETRPAWKSSYYEDEILRNSNNNIDVDWNNLCDTPEKRSLYSIYKYRDILWKTITTTKNGTKNVGYKKLLTGYISNIKSPCFVLQLKHMIFRNNNNKLSKYEHDFLLNYIVDHADEYKCNKSTSYDIRESLYNIIKSIVKEKKQPGINMSHIKEYVEWFKNNISKNDIEEDNISFELNFDVKNNEKITQ